MLHRRLDIPTDTHPIPRDEPWYFPPSSQESDSLEPHEANWLATIGMAIVFMFVGLLMIPASTGVGLGFVVLGAAVFAGSFLALKAEAGPKIDQETYDQWDETFDQWEEMTQAQELEHDLRTREEARKEARQREIDEIVKAVKSTIMVRCRYCGTLNEESASKCESCGANL